MDRKVDHDVVVIGAGFGGLYALHRFRDDLGLDVRVFERGSDVGGTWYWNRYPGARCDVESMFYSYSFSPELEQDWEWTERFPAQPEILAYAGHVADRFDLRRDISLETSVVSAAYDPEDGTWLVITDRGEQVRAAYLVTAVGCLSSSRVPDFPGLETFAGQTHHTGRWPHDGVDLTGRRVAVIGTGSSGVQAIPVIAERAAHVTVFQRTPHYTIPARNRPLRADEVAAIKADYRRYRAESRIAPGGVPIFNPPVGSALDVAEQTRIEELDRRWEAGGAAVMMTFNDTALNRDANEVLAAYVRDKIQQLVRDPRTATALTPVDYPIGAKRICFDTDYYDTYNRDNVTLVSLRETPIERITEHGVVVDGVEHPVDVIVFATGYDAMTGPLNAIDIRGADGALLRDVWSAGPRTYLGLSTAGFPNLFMVTGPGSPSVLVNMIVSIEQHVDWVCDLLTYCQEHDVVRVEARLDAQDRWVDHVNERAARTLYLEAASWYVGANVPGKPRVFMPYVGGMGPYRQTCDQVAADGYPGFTLTPRHGDGRPADAGSAPGTALPAQES